VLLPQLPIGPFRARIGQLRPELARAGIRLAVLRRDWDQSLWEFARAGFPELRRRIPMLLDSVAAATVAPAPSIAAEKVRATVQAATPTVEQQPRRLAMKPKGNVRPGNTAPAAGRSHGDAERIVVVERRRRRVVPKPLAPSVG
jgi:hypothetical protein